MITFALAYLRTAFSALHLDERAQDAFEYLLVIGGVAVVIVGLVATGMTNDLVDAVITGICNAIDGLAGFDMGTACD